ncbi:MAG: type I restriction enzyme HsdR N-terminal domain-containing protein [Bacteriovorax sp.]|nr:type I restriction enzyme HsdR N-terminal domain-containing protein [Bacteriovorax sp.]
MARGKSSSEEDARILLNDILHSVLGYNKFNELKTEMRDKNNRFDYGVRLVDGPFKNKADKLDFIIEAKACHIELNQMVIDQTLPYCISTGVDYFFLTNAVKWQMFKVSRQGKIPTAIKIHEVVFNTGVDYEELAEEFYLFSRWSYLNNDWKHVAEVTKATKVEDIVAVMLSDRIVKAISKELSSEHEVRVDEESVYEILEKTILKNWSGEFNKKLLKRLNEKSLRKEVSKQELSPSEAILVNKEDIVAEQVVIVPDSVKEVA